jgi:hypothetical protein
MKQNSTKATTKKPTVRKNVREAQEQLDAQTQTKNLNQAESNAIVAIKAYELFERRGGQHGFDQEDWFQAEQLVRQGF